MNKTRKALREKSRLTCPICGRERASARARGFLTVYRRQMRQAGAVFEAETLAEFFRRPHPAVASLRWACDDCLAAGRALPAKPWLQTFGLGPAHYAYWDRPGICQDCGEAFIFSASEQRYWYEIRKFIIDSHPKQCPRCRRRRRVRKGALLEVSRLMRALNGAAAGPALWIQLAEFYLRAEVTSRALEYYRRARNKARRTALPADLQVRLEALAARLAPAGAGTHNGDS